LKKKLVCIILYILLIATTIPTLGTLNKNITIPNDEYFNLQYSLHNTGQTGGIPDCDIDAPEAWDIETGNSDVIIAFIDSGIDYTHPDLASKIWINLDEIPGNGIDDDNNGYIDDVRGWDFYYDDNDPLDENGHGTICAGIAAAVSNNGVGIAGVCWDCQIMPLKVNGLYNTEDIPNLWIEAIYYAVDNGADIISMSLGIEYYHPQLENAVNYAYNHGVFLTASAGNQGWSDEHYPAAYENVVGVAATNDEDKRMENAGIWSSSSNYGSWVDVAAPGENIFSTMPTYPVYLNNWFPQNYTDGLCGTSCSAPHVAGLAALLISQNSSLSPQDLKTIICGTTDPYDSPYDLGSGRINAYKALLGYNSSLWDSTNGPIGERIRCFTSLGDDVFTATCSGVFVTSNNGSLWMPVNNGLTSCNIKDFITINDTIYASTDEGVFVSYNHGGNWTALDNGLRNIYVKTLSVSGNHIFAGTYTKGMYLSSDFGASWNQANNGITNMYIYTLSSDEKKTIAGTIGGGLFLSTDLGQTWSSINNGLPSDEEDILSVAIFDDYMLAGVLYGGIYKSVDNGQSWTLVDSSLNVVRDFVKIGNIIFAGNGNGVYQSIDEGETWTLVVSAGNLWAIGSAGPNLYVAVGDGYVYFSPDLGVTWIPVNTGIWLKTLIGSLVVNDNTIFAGSHGSNLYSTVDEGDTWLKVSGIGTVEIRTLAVNQGNIYAGTDLLGLFVSYNNGGSFSTINNGITSKWINSLCFKDNYIFTGTGEEGVFRSDNGGSSWIPVNTGLTSNNIVTLCVAGEYIYAGSDDQGIFRSSDNGSIWIPINNNLSTDWIETLLYDGNFLFAGTGDEGLYISSNFGDNWTQINNGLQGNNYIRSLISSYGILFCGTNLGGVFYSPDNGSNWYDINIGLDNLQVRSLLLDGTFLYAGTNADGVCKRSVFDIILTFIDIQLYVGWNLISITFNESVDKTNIIVSYEENNYTWREAVTNGYILEFIYRWNATTQNYETVDTLQPGKGYWMYAYNKFELFTYGLTGIPTDDYITDIPIEWNMVGLPDDEPVEKQNLSILYNGTFYGWDNATTSNNEEGEPLILGFIYGWNSTSQNYETIDVLLPGKSYWMYAYYDCTLRRT